MLGASVALGRSRCNSLRRSVGVIATAAVLIVGIPGVAASLVSCVDQSVLDCTNNYQCEVLGDTCVENCRYFPMRTSCEATQTCTPLGDNDCARNCSALSSAACVASAGGVCMLQSGQHCVDICFRVPGNHTCNMRSDCEYVAEGAQCIPKCGHLDEAQCSESGDCNFAGGQCMLKCPSLVGKPAVCSAMPHCRPNPAHSSGCVYNCSQFSASACPNIKDCSVVSGKCELQCSAITYNAAACIEQPHCTVDGSNECILKCSMLATEQQCTTPAETVPGLPATPAAMCVWMGGACEQHCSFLSGSECLATPRCMNALHITTCTTNCSAYMLRGECGRDRMCVWSYRVGRCLASPFLATQFPHMRAGESLPGYYVKNATYESVLPNCTEFDAATCPAARVYSAKRQYDMCVRANGLCRFNCPAYYSLGTCPSPDCHMVDGLCQFNCAVASRAVQCVAPYCQWHGSQTASSVCRPSCEYQMDVESCERASSCSWANTVCV